MKEELPEKIQQTIDRHRMLPEEGRVIVAVSGGVDSMVLLAVLVGLRARYRVTLHVAHLDHGLRGRESAEAAVFVGRQCDAYRIPATISTADAGAFRRMRGGSIEAAARELRYQFLDRVADEQGATRIALGHHRDDQAETVLMNLLRGSGVRGLGAIPPVRNRIVRPLIDCSRREIEAFARREGISHVEDSSNTMLSLSRNRIRLELLPDLARRYNPRVAEALASAAEIFQAEDALLSAMTEERLADVVVSRSGREMVLSVSRMASLPTALRRRILRAVAHLLAGDRPGLSFQHTLALDRLLVADGAGKSLNAAGGIRATRSGDRLLLSVGAYEEEDARPFALTVPCRTTLPWGSLRFRTDFLDTWTGDHLVTDRWTALLDADRAGRELLVRGWQPGDRFVPLGMADYKKLQDFFVDAKVPRERRRAVPLVVSGGKIAWVVGFRVDDRFKVTDATRRILRVCATEDGRSHEVAGGL